MVQIELVAWQSSTTVLACAFVSCVDIITTEPDLPLGHAIVTDEEKNARNANGAIHQTDGIVVSGHGQVAPAFEIESLVLLVHCLRDTLIEKDKCPAHRRNMNR